jgi:hypothetical protein
MELAYVPQVKVVELESTSRKSWDQPPVNAALISVTVMLVRAVTGNSYGECL